MAKVVGGILLANLARDVCCWQRPLGAYVLANLARGILLANFAREGSLLVIFASNNRMPPAPSLP